MPKHTPGSEYSVRFRAGEVLNGFFTSLPARSELYTPSGKSCRDLITHLNKHLEVLRKATNRQKSITSDADADKTIKLVIDDLDMVIRVIRLFYTENKNLRKKYGGEEKTIKQLRAEHASAFEEYQKISSRNRDQAEVIERLGREKSALNEKCNAITTEMDQSKRTVHDQERQISLLMEENRNLSSNLESLKQQHPQLNTHIKKLEDDLSSAKETIIDYKSEIEDLKRAITEKENFFTTEKRRVYDQGYSQGSSDQQRNIDIMDMECTKYRKEIDTLNKRCESLQELIDNLQKKSTKLSTELTETKSQLSLSQRNYEDAVNLTKRLQIDIERLKTKNNDLKTDHKVAADELQAQLNRSKRYSEKLANDLEKLRKDYEDLSSIRGEKEISLKRLTNEVQSLKAELHEKDESIVLLNAKYDSSERQRQSLKISEASLQESIVKLEKTLSTQAIRLQELDITDYSRLKEKLSQSLEDLSQAKQAEDSIKQQFIRQSAEWNTIHASLKSEILDLTTKLQNAENELTFYRSNETNADSSMRTRYEQLYNKRVNEIMDLCRIEINEREREITELKQNRDMFKDNHHKACVELGNVKMQLDRLKTEFDVIAPTQQRVSGLLEEISKLTQKINEYEGYISSLESKLELSSRNSSTMHETLATKNQELQSLLDQRKSDIQELQSLIEQKNGNIKELQSLLETKISETQELHSHFKSLMEKKENELNESRSSLKSLQSSYNDSERQKKLLIAKVNDFEQRLERIRKEYENVKRQAPDNTIVDQLREQLQHAYQKLSMLENDKVEALAEIQGLRKNSEDMLVAFMPVYERIEGLVASLRFIKSLHDYYYPSLDAFIDGELERHNIPQKRTLKGAFLTALALVKFKNGGIDFANHTKNIESMKSDSS